MVECFVFCGGKEEEKGGRWVKTQYNGHITSRMVAREYEVRDMDEI